MGREETDIQDAVKLAISQTEGPVPQQWHRAYRNNVGNGFLSQQRTPGSRRVDFGLDKGSGDLIGHTPLLILPEHVGCLVAVFGSTEIKTLTGRMRDDQRDWIQRVQHFGGFACVARSPEEYRQAWSLWRPLPPELLPPLPSPRHWRQSRALRSKP